MVDQAPPQSPSHPSTQSPPLWQLLTHCADIVQAVESGRSLTDCLTRCPAPLRPGVQALTFTVMRRLGMANATLSALVPKPPAPWVRGLLLSALSLCDEASYSPHTLVNQAVQACKRKAASASGMVNAVLRRYLREHTELKASLQSQANATWNHPTWWIEHLQRDWPDQWQDILTASNRAAPLMLRVNRRHGSVQAYQQRLEAMGIPSSVIDQDGLVLHQAIPVGRLPGFDAGDVSVQDRHAQWAAPLLLGSGVPPGARILDACSAPGGKTAHLLECMDADMLALDVDAERLARVADTLQRVGVSATLKAADAGQPDTWWDGQAFDAILLDAPCSASGIVRRHPDVRWLRRPSDLPALAKTQQHLLQTLWPLLKPGGALLYCTCSIFKMEGQEVIDAFLQRHADAHLLDSPGHLLPVVEYPMPASGPALSGDGFFYALLRKQATTSP